MRAIIIRNVKRAAIATILAVIVANAVGYLFHITPTPEGYALGTLVLVLLTVREVLKDLDSTR